MRPTFAIVKNLKATYPGKPDCCLPVYILSVLRIEGHCANMDNLVGSCLPWDHGQKCDVMLYLLASHRVKVHKRFTFSRRCGLVVMSSRTVVVMVRIK